MTDLSNPIAGFIGPHEFLSNDYDAGYIAVAEPDGTMIEYPTLTHAFHAMKTHNTAIRKRIAEYERLKPLDTYARKMQVRQDWDDVQLAVMYELLRTKFYGDLKLMERLLDTEDRALFHDNRYHDNFWGNCTCQIGCHKIRGLNILGIQIMQVRSELHQLTT